MSLLDLIIIAIFLVVDTFIKPIPFLLLLIVVTLIVVRAVRGERVS